VKMDKQIIKRDKR